MPNMDHREFLNSLPADTRRKLSQRKRAPGLLRLAINSLILLLVSAGIISEVPGWPLLMLLQALLLVCQFHLLHECVHDTPFTSTSMNLWVARITGFLLFLPSNWFRYFHLAHHRCTQDPEKDPELQSGKPKSLAQWFLHLTGITVWHSQLTTLFNALTKPCNFYFIPKSKQYKVRKEILLMWVGYITLFIFSVTTGEAELLYIWIIPLLLGQPFLRLYLLAEHGNCPYVSNMFANTRTVFTNPVVRWFTWNMPYHTEHHVFPTVPFHNLPLLHEIMRANLIKTNKGYVSFNWQYVSEIRSSD